MGRPTYARIDLDAIIHNVRAVKELVGGRGICAAVKADAYGHGAPAAARAMSTAGADMFGVAMTEEAVELRRCGICEPIMLLTPVPDYDIDELLDYGITACICEEEFARALAQRAVKRGVTAEAQVNMDTGMRRVGVPHESAAETLLRIARLPGLRITGIFSHFACAGDRDQSVSREQLARFRRAVGAMARGGLRLPMLHMANSAAVLKFPEACLDAVRPGLILYGLYPADHAEADRRRLALRPALSLHTRISFIKVLPAGEKIGYGHTATTRRTSVIATLPIGYHDGYVRQYSNCGWVLVRGRRAPVIGRVCMDQTLVDVTDVPGAARDDEVVVYGEQQGARIGIEEMAAILDRVPYELTCSVGGRVRRQYLLNGVVAAETPMRSLVPPELVDRMFQPQAAPADERIAKDAARRGAA